MSRLERLTARVRERGPGDLPVTTPGNTCDLRRFETASCTRPSVVVARAAPVPIVSQAEEDHARARSAIGDIRTCSDRQVGGAGGMSPMPLALGPRTAHGPEVLSPHPGDREALVVRA
jgi:hypothetical protein